MVYFDIQRALSPAALSNACGHWSDPEYPFEHFAELDVGGVTAVGTLDAPLLCSCVIQSLTPGDVNPRWA